MPLFESLQTQLCSPPAFSLGGGPDFMTSFHLDSIEEWDDFAFVFMARNPVVLKVL